VTGAPGPQGDGARAAAQLAADLQRAAGAIAARRRGDLGGTRALLADFRDADARAQAFMLVADLSLTMLSQTLEEPLDDTVQRLTLALETRLGAA
jgi:Fe-Mn family superoxide dismutase